MLEIDFLLRQTTGTGSGRGTGERGHNGRRLSANIWSKIAGAGVGSSCLFELFSKDLGNKGRKIGEKLSVDL